MFNRKSHVKWLNSTISVFEDIFIWWSWKIVEFRASYNINTSSNYSEMMLCIAHSKFEKLKLIVIKYVKIIMLDVFIKKLDVFIEKLDVFIKILDVFIAYLNIFMNFFKKNTSNVLLFTNDWIFIIIDKIWLH